MTIAQWFLDLKPGNEVAIATNGYQAITFGKVKRRTPGSNWVVLEDGRRFRPDQYSGQTIIELNTRKDYAERARLLPATEGKERLRKLVSTAQTSEQKLAAQREELARSLELFSSWSNLTLEQLTKIREIAFGAEEAHEAQPLRGDRNENG